MINIKLLIIHFILNTCTNCLKSINSNIDSNQYTIHAMKLIDFVCRGAYTVERSLKISAVMSAYHVTS